MMCDKEEGTDSRSGTSSLTVGDLSVYVYRCIIVYMLCVDEKKKEADGGYILQQVSSNNNSIVLSNFCLFQPSSTQIQMQQQHSCWMGVL